MTQTETQSLMPHRRAVLQALLVTFLWSTSWVLIKIGLVSIPPLTFAGLRYGLAALLLLAWGARRGLLRRLARLPARRKLELAGLGLVYYAVTQGAQFVALAYLPAITVNLLLGFTPALVALVGIFFLAERPGFTQWVGVGLGLVGTLVYFYPVNIPAGQALGLAAAVLSLLANVLGSVMGRSNNRRGDLTPVEITTASMSIGALLLLPGVAVQGIPPLSPQNLLILVWLAVVNTAFAFTLWNLSLRTLTAVESSIINNTMSIQIPILAVIFLGERLNLQQMAGLALAILGAWLVQRRKI